MRGEPIVFDKARVRTRVYRPFEKRRVYVDAAVNEVPGQVGKSFPADDVPNVGFYCVGLSSSVPFSVLAVDALPNLHLTGAGSGGQFYSRYTYRPRKDPADDLFSQLSPSWTRPMSPRMGAWTISPTQHLSNTVQLMVGRSPKTIFSTSSMTPLPVPAFARFRGPVGMAYEPSLLCPVPFAWITRATGKSVVLRRRSAACGVTALYRPGEPTCAIEADPVPWFLCLPDAGRSQSGVSSLLKETRTGRRGRRLPKSWTMGNCPGLT